MFAIKLSFCPCVSPLHIKTYIGGNIPFTIHKSTFIAAYWTTEEVVK